jgi:hypothetical protein
MTGRAYALVIPNNPPIAHKWPAITTSSDGCHIMRRNVPLWYSALGTPIPRARSRSLSSHPTTVTRRSGPPWVDDRSCTPDPHLANLLDAGAARPSARIIHRSRASKVDTVSYRRGCHAPPRQSPTKRPLVRPTRQGDPKPHAPRVHAGLYRLSTNMWTARAT